MKNTMKMDKWEKISLTRMGKKMDYQLPNMKKIVIDMLNSRLNQDRL
jgi:hypothetical protein